MGSAVQTNQHTVAVYDRLQLKDELRGTTQTSTVRSDELPQR